MVIKLYIEGGGESKELHSRCREGFRTLLEKAGFAGRLPRLVAGGGRDATFDLFRTSVLHAKPGDYSILLVDSEEAVINRRGAWAHLQLRDGWTMPGGVEDDQVNLMVTCMETWIIADRNALHAFFGTCIHEDSLLSLNKLEDYSRASVQDSLINSTRHCNIAYKKGALSFKILSTLNPEILRQHLPHFLTFIHALERHL